MFTIYAPASIANINVGFDLLGVAILSIEENIFLGDCVKIVCSKKFSISESGRFKHMLPKNKKDNIVYHVWKKFCQEIEEKVLVHIVLQKNIPVGSGLGSSASSIVATLVALNKYCSFPLNNNKMLKIMGDMESIISGVTHFDNVSPCFLGGMQLITKEKDVISQSIPFFSEWLWVIAYPGTVMNTINSRSVLPKKYSRKDCIDYGRCLAGFIHASYTQQSKLASDLMKDVIGEPYRVHYFSDFLYIREKVMDLGSIVFGLSGSGPTLFAICEKLNIAVSVSSWLTNNYLKNNFGFVYICRVDTLGARVL